MHLFLEKPNLALCSKCKKLSLPHNVCKNCGYYKGTEVIDVLKKLDRKERKKREKELKTDEKDKKEKPLNLEELSKK